ncbi:MAG TPA: hypothetical protein VK205_01195, partial [Prolixibacteraceae bacterium]|nr:hypothetical protein [Prolixibacteraceae bacterium]
DAVLREDCWTFSLISDWCFLTGEPVSAAYSCEINCFIRLENENCLVDKISGPDWVYASPYLQLFQIQF